MKKILFAAIVLALGAAWAFPQTQERGERRMPPGESVVGKVTAVGKDSVTVTPLAGGQPVTIKVVEKTRIFKEREPIKLTDIQVEETVVARGQMNGDAMEAGMLRVVSPEMAQHMQQGGPGGQGGRGQFNPEDMGKKFIAGEVKSIQETKLTIARPDNQTQDLQVDENTSFKKGGESVTLADIKAGDFVRGTGELKNGVFVPKELIVGGRPRMRMNGGPEAPKNEPKN